jgi:hypothetical protein
MVRACRIRSRRIMPGTNSRGGSVRGYEVNLILVLDAILLPVEAHVIDPRRGSRRPPLRRHMRSHLSLPPSLRVLPVAAHLSLKRVTNIERSSGAMRFPFYRDAAARYLIIFAWAFRRSAQYRFMRWETALRPAADIRLVRFVACSSERRSARRRCGSASSGNVRSIAMS